jgi:hypothetical protein
MLHEHVRPRGAPTISPLSGWVVAAARPFLTRGTLAARLVIAGTLLLVGLPALTIVVYGLGYPTAPVPLAVVVLVDGLQLLIVLNAAVVVAQLARGAGIRIPWTRRTHMRMANVGKPRARFHGSGPTELHVLSFALVEMIWEEERNGRPGLDQAVLDYIREAVTVELEHRRRVATLEQRLAALEAGLQDGPARGRRRATNANGLSERHAVPKWRDGAVASERI